MSNSASWNNNYNNKQFPLWNDEHFMATAKSWGEKPEISLDITQTLIDALSSKYCNIIFTVVILKVLRPIHCVCMCVIHHLLMHSAPNFTKISFWEADGQFKECSRIKMSRFSPASIMYCWLPQFVKHKTNVFTVMHLQWARAL